MKKLNFVFNLQLVALAALVAFGCSAKQRSVVSRPPQIPNRVSKLEKEVGRLSPESISVFLWPPFRNESDMTDTFATVNGASDSIDKLTTQIVVLMKQNGGLRVQFAQMGCWNFTTQVSKPENHFELVTDWKTANTPEEAVQIQACKVKQDERLPIMGEIGRLKTVEIAKHGLIIRETVNRDGNQNFRSPSSDDTKQSYFLLRSSSNGIGVKVMLFGFAGMGIKQSTDEGESTQVNGTDNARIRDAAYDMTLKSLSFKVPEFVKTIQKAADGTDTEVFVETGIYEFTMERSDFVVWARFEGNVTYTSLINGEVRTGSVSIYGSLTE